MKKYLINGALALIVGFTYTSCKNNDVDYVPIAQQKTQAYAEAFKEMIGGEVDPNQNWGFETITISEEELAAARAAVRAGTRTHNVNGNQWKGWGYTIPEPIGQDELNNVLAVFNQVGAASYESLVDWDEFFVQQVYKGVATYHDATDNNKEFTGSDKMNELACWDPTGQYYSWDEYIWNPAKNANDIIKHEGYNHDDIINNFNGGNCTTTYYSDGDNNHEHPITGITLMQNTSTQKFSYKSSQGGGQRFYYFRMEKINGNYYVGFDFASERQASANANEQVERDYIYNDWIVKICPGKGTPITNVGGEGTTDTETITNAKYERKKLMLQGRVFCEDLAKATRADIDFNDIVFDARIWRVSEFTKTNGVDNNDDNFLRYEAEICLLAAGGTIPANVASRDVHDLFGVGLTTMVNTVDGNSTNVTIKWDNSSATKPVKHFTFDMTELITNNNGDISLDLIPIEVMWTTSDTNDPGIGQMKSVGRLGANVGDVPYKFCAPIGTPWASERNPIVDVYSGFADWAKGGSEPNWGNGTNLRYNNCPNGLSTDSKYVIGYTEEKQISSTSTTTTEIETVLWQGSRAMEYSASGNNGKYAMVFNSNDIKVGDKLRIYGTKSTGDAKLELKNNESGWQIIADINLSDLNNYKEIDVTEGMVSAMTSTTVNSWGRGCSITKITRWRKTVTTN